MVLGNNETANKGTTYTWRLSSPSARLRIRRNTKLNFQDTMPMTASKNKEKNGHKPKYNSRFSTRKSSGKLSADYRQPCLAAHLESIYQAHTCVLCRECNSMINHDLLPDCGFTLEGLNQLQNYTGTTKGECQSLKCPGIKYYHYKQKLFCPQN
jgi:hypothetical protein